MGQDHVLATSLLEQGLLFFHSMIKTPSCRSRDIRLCVAVEPQVGTVPGAALSLAAAVGRESRSHFQGLFLAL